MRLIAMTPYKIDITQYLVAFISFDLLLLFGFVSDEL